MIKRVKIFFERYFPERRLFLRSDLGTRFIRLSSLTQASVALGVVFIVAWTIIASAILFMDSIGSGNFRAQAERNQFLYEQRLNALSKERDTRYDEARAAQERFNAALSQISVMQSELLRNEDRRRELETGLDVVQKTLRDAIKERETMRTQFEQLADQASSGQGVTLSDEASKTADLLASALSDTAKERDRILKNAQVALDRAASMEKELLSLQTKTDEIFRKLEDALKVSVKPLEKIFRSTGLNVKSLLDHVRRGYSGQGGAFGPIQPSSYTSDHDHHEHTGRANDILNSLDQLNLYRIAAERIPLDMPVKGNFRFTSGFGQRWGRLHAGSDFAGPVGTKIVASGDGVVTHAGWVSGYGRLIKIKHEFGIETRYAHLNRIRVSVGQKVSRGQRIGDMGNSGRSTGPHLHYEVRVDGKPVNPMIYIRAGRDVF